MPATSPFVSIKVHVAETRAASLRLERDMARATMYGIRAAGRKVKQSARRNAPVGGTVNARWSARKGDFIYTKDHSTDPHPGQLRASIHSSRRLRSEGPLAYSLRVAPMSREVVPYRAKIEESSPYMRVSFVAGLAASAEAYAAAYRRTMAKYRG